MVRFKHQGITGAILPGGFVLWGGMGFHIADVRGSIITAIERAQAKCKRRFVR